MAPRLSGQSWKVLKLLSFLYPYNDIEAYRAGYQTGEKEFWNEMPPNGSMQIIVRVTDQCIFCHLIC